MTRRPRSKAFDDTWTWSQQAEAQYLDLVQGGAPAQVADAIEAMRRLLGDNDVLAYLVMMTARLVELHRVLKPTGALYLHCDPTASHYLKGHAPGRGVGDGRCVSLGDVLHRFGQFV